MSDAEGGRIFFSSTGRSLVDEDEIVVLSVGVDIGSSTSHLVFSRIVLERLDSRYVVSTREAFYQSDILLTPYAAEEEIDAEALGAFIEQQYKTANVDPDEIDTGALILTGVAVRRRNARRIGELFARQAGKMVAVSAGDSLETVMAAHGSGAAARSIRDKATVMNVDVGGGTSKIAVCADGRVTDVTALDVGARLVCLDPAGRIVRVEEAGRRFAAELGIDVTPGAQLAPEHARALAAAMADRLFEAMGGASPVPRAARASCASMPLSSRTTIDQLTFSGGVAEYIYGREAQTYGDLGVLLAQEIRVRADAWGPKLDARERGHPRDRDRRLAIHHAGERQHHLRLAARGAAAAQRAGHRAAPSRSTATRSIQRPWPRRSRRCSSASISTMSDTPVAVFVPWRGSATFQRLDAFCQGVVDGLAGNLADHHPLVLAGDGDVGGLMGIHLREEMQIDNAIVSVDGLELKEFDYIDIGAMLANSGAVPVVIKSLIFPASAAPGMEWQPTPRVLGQAQ